MTALSPQETKLYSLLLQDLRMKEIAAQMKLHANTVDTYAKSIYTKKRVQGRIGLLIQFYEDALTKEKTSPNLVKTKGISL